MRRYLIILLLFLGLTGLTLAVGAQESETAESEEALPQIVANPPEQMIAGEWQPLTLEPLDSEHGQGRFAPFQVEDAGSDTCGSATLLTPPTGDTSDVTGHVDGSGDPVLGCMWGSPISSQGYRTTWYQLSSPSTGVVTIDTLNSNYDTVLSVYTGACGGLTQFSCNDDNQGFSSRVSFIALKGVTYYVSVADWQQDPPPGGATLNISALIAPIDSRWKPDGVMALARSRHATVVVGSDIYVVGGQSGSLGTPVVEKRLDRFDTTTGSWATLADKPGTAGYSNTTAAYVDGPNDNGRIYLPAGYTGNNSEFGGDHWAYDISADSWITATNAPWPGGTPIAWSAAVANPSETGYYLTGGLSTLPAFDINAQVHDQVFFYSAQTNSWSPKTSMSSARYAHTAALVGGRVCVAGGISTGNVLLINGECHTPGSGTWTNTFDMNTPRYMAGSAVGQDGKWYVFGGVDAVGNAVVTTEVYDPATNSWTPLDVSYDLGGTATLPARAWPRGEFVGSTVWAIGGNNDANLALPLVEKLFVASSDLLLPLLASGYDSDDAPDGTFGQARQLTLNQPQHQDFDNLLDFYDVFSFVLTSQKVITISLTNIPSGNDLSIALYSANKLLWSTSDNPGPLDESITSLRDAGRYYVVVQRVDGLPQAGQNYQILVKDQP